MPLVGRGTASEPPPAISLRLREFEARLRGRLRRLTRGYPDRRDVAFYRSLLPRGALTFDIGANVGDITAPLLAAGARVVAVEPHPQAMGLLKSRCDRYPGFLPVAAAVGSSTGTATLYLHGHHASSSLHPEWYGPPTGSIEVPMMMLSSLVEAYGLPHYCKVDVEGSELQVFATLRERPPLVSFEYVDFALDRAAECAGLLAAGTELQANVGLTNPARFHLDRWVPVEDLLERIPAWIREGTLKPWGDIWLREE